MKYRDTEYISGVYIEHEVHAVINYGAKGQKRSEKKRPTPLQISKQNHWQKVKTCRRTIQANFSDDDLWVTLCYKRGTRKSMREFIRDVQRFQNLLKVEYKKQGKELKWIRRLEIGKRGGLHAHFILNNPGSTKLIRDTWQKSVKAAGRVNFENLYYDDGFNTLAEYICKEPDEEIQGQMSFLIPGEKKKLCSISSSRNLKRPEPVIREISSRSLKEVLRGDKVIKPTDGYYIEPDSIRSGLNKYTGLPYLRYRERRLKPEEAKTEIKKPKTEIKTQKVKTKCTKCEQKVGKSKRTQNKTLRERIFKPIEAAADKAAGLLRRFWR